MIYSGVNFRSLQDYEHLLKRLEGVYILDAYHPKPQQDDMRAYDGEIFKGQEGLDGSYEAKDILNQGVSQGFSQGISQGINQGIQAMITACRELNVSFENDCREIKV